MGLKNNLITNEYAFSVITKISGVLLGLIYTVVFSRYFEAELRGVSTVIYAYSEFFMLIACFGTYQGYPYYKKQGKKNIYEEYVNIVTGMLLLYLAISVILILLLWGYFEICTVIALIPFSFATKEFNYVVMIENPSSMNRAVLLLGVVENVLVLLFSLVFKRRLTILILFMVCREIIYFFVTASRLKIKLCKIRPTLKGIVPYLRFGIIPMVTVIMMELNYKADVAMLDYFKVKHVDIGVYGLGVTLVSKVWLIPDALKDILTSKLAKGKQEDEVCKVLRISFFVILLFILALIILGKPFISLLYGTSFEGAYNIIVIMLVGVVGMVFYKLIYPYNVINGYQKVNLFILGCAALINVIFNAIMIPISGCQGAALASSVSYFICGLLYVLYFSKKACIPIKEMIVLKRNDIEKIKGLLNK